MSDLLDRLLRDARTARHIPIAQLWQRARFLVLRQRYARQPGRPIEAARVAAQGSSVVADPGALDADLLLPEGSDAVRRRADDAAAGRFVHLGAAATYPDGIDWVDAARSPLWQYQMQYLGSVLDLAVGGRGGDAAALIGSWHARHGGAWDPVAWHPYPVSLRLANVCHAAGALGSFDRLGNCAADLVLTHAAYLLEHLERDVRGNHLLENARALLVAAHHVRGPLSARCAATGRALLVEEIPEQILADGGHFERAPMYHVIVLHRVLELVALLPPGDEVREQVVMPAARRMCGFLRATLCPDGDILLFGDSARAFAPPPAALLHLAERLVGPGGGAASAPAPDGAFLARDSGLAVLRGGGAWVAFDTGPVCPAYLPAHGQADTLTLEVWIGGVRVVADPGLAEYTGPERAWGRSSRAHSTITLDDANHSEVYGSFRVGGRETYIAPEVRDECVVAAVQPWPTAARLRRSVRVTAAGAVRVDDDVRGGGSARIRSRLHLAPGVSVVRRDSRSWTLDTRGGRVAIRSAHDLSAEPGRCATELGNVEATTLVGQDLPSEDGTARGWWEIAPLSSGDA